MNETKELEIVDEDHPLTASDVRHQINLIQEIMRDAMKPGEHYGKIPGCGEKPSLLKAGAEKLNLTFRLAPKFDLEIINLERGHREYRVITNLYAIRSGKFLGSGVGSASTMETKWRFRLGPAEYEYTGSPVPKSYWEARKEDPKKAQDLLGGRGFAARKNPDTGQWEIVSEGERVEHDNPADNYNTCLKMAKKRSMVDAVLTVTAASDIFTQDLEEIAENAAEPTEKPTQSPKEKQPELHEPRRLSEKAKGPQPPAEAPKTEVKPTAPETPIGSNISASLGTQLNIGEPGIVDVGPQNMAPKPEDSLAEHVEADFKASIEGASTQPELSKIGNALHEAFGKKALPAEAHERLIKAYRKRKGELSKEGGK